MTRKDYVAIAQELSAIMPSPAVDGQEKYDVWYSCCHAVAQVFGDDNPRFDYKRFYDACHALTVTS